MSKTIKWSGADSTHFMRCAALPGFGRTTDMDTGETYKPAVESDRLSRLYVAAYFRYCVTGVEPEGLDGYLAYLAKNETGPVMTRARNAAESVKAAMFGPGMAWAAEQRFTVGGVDVLMSGSVPFLGVFRGKDDVMVDIKFTTNTLDVWEKDGDEKQARIERILACCAIRNIKAGTERTMKAALVVVQQLPSGIRGKAMPLTKVFMLDASWEDQKRVLETELSMALTAAVVQEKLPLEIAAHRIAMANPDAAYVPGGYIRGAGIHFDANIIKCQGMGGRFGYNRPCPMLLHCPMGRSVVEATN